MKTCAQSFIVVLVFGLLVVACGRKTTITVWNDLKVANKAAVTCNFEEVNCLRIQVDGTVEGAGRLITPNLRTNLLSGTVHTNYSMDYYETNCTILFEPVTSTGGKLKLAITFSRF
jgi:hypothetical protein